MGTDMKTEDSNKKSLGVSIEAGSDPGMSAERGNSLYFENTSVIICYTILIQFLILIFLLHNY